MGGGGGWGVRTGVGRGTEPGFARPVDGRLHRPGDWAVAGGIWLGVGAVWARRVERG